MIPLWYAVCLMLGTGFAGYLCSQLWPIVSATRLARLRKRALRQVAELRRLTSWSAPVVHWEAGPRDDWSLPVSPRLTDRDRIEAAKAAALDGQDLPTQHGTLHENARRQELVRHAAPVPDIDWHRGEHRLFSWGWVVEVVARLASVGAKPNLPLAVDEYTPRHTDEWLVSTQEIAKVVEEETRRRDDEFEALLYSLVAKGAVLR